jgi:glycosyltransferase involved in cell wall biosynthesis
MSLYTRSGRRRIAPPIIFGLGVFWHLLGRGRRYDVVHTGGFPYFSVLASAVVRRLGGYRLIVDWVEFWRPDYWRSYLGAIRGRIGWSVQQRCAHVRQEATCLAAMTANRLREAGVNGNVTVLRGLYDGPHAGDTVYRAPEAAPNNRVVFAGRLIAEKQVPALVAAVALARRENPDITLDVYGDGPERAAVEAASDSSTARGAVSIHGFLAADDVADALRHATCVVLPSAREGFGLVLVEACAYGTPVIAAQGEDNAATELIVDGVNGALAASAAPHDLAHAIQRVIRAGQPLRNSTSQWYADHAAELSLQSSLTTALQIYASGTTR